MSMGRRPRDLSGQKFGLLTAMYPTERRDHRGSVYWHCVCECGNEIDVSAGALLDGNNRTEPQMTAIAVKIYASRPFPNR